MSRHGARSSREFIFHALAGVLVMPIVLGLMALDSVSRAIKTLGVQDWKKKTYNLTS